MLEKILSISGKSGLFRLMSNGKNTLIVESLTTKKRLPVHARDRVVSLQEISIFTTEGDVRLAQVLEKVRVHYAGNPIDLTDIKDNEKLRELMGEVLPTFDRERVYPTDIKKLFVWYNILIEDGFTSFVEPEEEAKEDQ